MAIKDRLAKMEKRERTLLMVLGGVVLLFIIYFLFLRGGGTSNENRQLAPPPNIGRRSPTPTASPGASNAPGSFEVFEGKDPFKPLIGQNAGGGGQSPGSTASPGPTGGPTGGERVVLLDIFKEGDTLFASVQVNGVEYKVKEGDTFDGNFRVVSLSSKCGTFVFGDERFTLCIGQEVFK